MKIGFIGVGNIGAPIAGQLLAAGHRLLVYDIRRAGADALLAAGAEWSESPGSLTARSARHATWRPSVVCPSRVRPPLPRDACWRRYCWMYIVLEFSSLW